MKDEPIEVIEARADSLLEAQEQLLRELVALRIKHDLGQDVLAKRMGISQPAVSQFERYDSNPKMSTLRRYALAVVARIRFEVIDDYVLATMGQVQIAPQFVPSINSQKTPTVAWGSSSSREVCVP